MKTQKMSLANIQGKLSRMEMKNIMAGDDNLADDGGDEGCLHAGSVCTKSSRCCSKSCGDADSKGKRHCDGA